MTDFLAALGLVFVIEGLVFAAFPAQAKRAMIYSITGVIVGMVGLVILYAVGRIFSVQQI